MEGVSPISIAVIVFLNQVKHLTLHCIKDPQLCRKSFNVSVKIFQHAYMLGAFHCYYC